MSRKYPHEDGARNTAINRERQRYAHTASYHTAHLQREASERAQAKVDAFKQADPARFERMQARKAEGPTVAGTKGDNSSGETASKGGPSGAAGLSVLGLGAEVIGGLTVGEILIAVAVIAVVAYGGYRFYKWYQKT